MNRLLIRIWAAWFLASGLLMGPAEAWTMDATWWLTALHAREIAAERSVAVAVEMDPPVPAWLEITSLTTDAPATVLRWRPTDQVEIEAEAEAELEVWRPPLGLFVQGPALLCAGAPKRAITCGPIFLGPNVTSRIVLATGLEITGSYLLDGLPVASARVAVVPAGLTWPRPFIMPLGPPPRVADGGSESGALRRSVATDEDGRFRLPRLAAGRYQLETVLPDGRVHHGVAFEVPEVADARRQLGVFDEAAPAWDLGEMWLDGGLEITFEVADLAGNPLVGAMVFGRQGALPRELVTFEARTDADGHATLSGFDVGLPVRVGCRAANFRDHEAEYALLPVVVDCALAPLSGIVGRVLGPDDLPPTGAQVVVRPFDETATADRTASELAPVTARISARDERSVGAVRARQTPKADGRFTLLGLEPGHYRIDVAAPGHAGDRYEVLLDSSGTALDLGTIRLLRGQPIRGVAVDSDSGEPLPGATIRVVEPPAPETATSDLDGQFELRSGDRGAVILEAWLEGYARGRFAFGAEAQAAAEPLTLPLAVGGRILAVLWDAETGRACVGCTLRILPGGHELTTDAAGEALSQVLKPGRYRVERSALVHKGSSVVERPDAESRRARVRVGGVVPVWFGERRHRLSVRLSPTPEGTWYLSARGRGRRLQLVPEPDGHYILELESGETLSLYLEQYDPASGYAREVRIGTVEGPTEVGQGATELTLPLASGVVTARVRRDGLAAARIAVRLLALADRTLIAGGGTDQDGGLRLAHLPPGVYALELDGVPARILSVGVGQTLELGDFDLFPRR